MEFLAQKHSNENVLDGLEGEEAADTYGRWMKQFQSCVQFDKWGQVVEAVEAYQALERTFTVRVENDTGMSEVGLEGVGGMTRRQRDNCVKLAFAMKLRIATMEDGRIDGPSNDEMDIILESFVAIVHGLVSFPLKLEQYDIQQSELDKIARFESMTPLRGEIEISHEVPTVPSIGPPHIDTAGSGGGGDARVEKSPVKYSSSQTPLTARLHSSSHVYSATAISNGGALKPPLPPSHTLSYFSLSLNKVGLKDASTYGYIDPYVIITVADARSCIIDQQQTPVSRRISGDYIHFDDIMVHLSIPIYQITEGNCGIFLELMHYKSEKKKCSCRCWSFLECDEVENGEMCLEIYKKPADYAKRKNRIWLHSVKELFFHVKGFVRKADQEEED
ncbi:hypothetical protein TrVE_jg5727 [Triparma verrucosa]|uniref:C2 Aida-type domain-containing protein n=1 Tax=Triparma verrucosa TaxID=1606542 RepID=A0A9W6ZA36_9STRA|nr:hypothetical protein TrVE_jg5727 [Triparma verrucosa]